MSASSVLTMLLYTWSCLPPRACAALPSSYQDLSYGCSLCNPT